MMVAKENGRQTKFDSIDHFIQHHTKLCSECEEERLNYELNKDEVCIYCEKKEGD